ncbi:hypothetical protein LCGC14_2316770 [marine sediment metagenome]|uniref:Uncharacterized protein n=1 Tax=marine sediment metagenome TaxID=412755 RepID=A0A0F9FDY0_9ZZZZ
MTPLQELRAHMDASYFGFDWHATEIVLAATMCHYLPAYEPINLFLVGPTTTGKTEIIRCLEKLPKVISISNLTPKALFSIKKGKSLMRDVIGADGILLFKDFTTILSRRKDDQLEIIADLREVADGKYERWTGEDTAFWHGKATVLAACTDAIDRSWGVMTGMGSRFFVVRWPRPEGRQQAKAAMLQTGREQIIRDKSTEITCKLFRGLANISLPGLPPHMVSEIADLSELCAIMRTPIHHSGPHQQLLEPQEPEGTARLAKALSLLVRAKAALYNKRMEDIDSGDMDTARRIARDSSPRRRLQLVQALQRKNPISIGELCTITRLPYGSMEWYIAELVALGIIDHDRSEDGKIWYSLLPAFQSF